jgi:DNA-directed RNA polymerase specialized sigma54-like protein
MTAVISEEAMMNLSTTWLLLKIFLQTKTSLDKVIRSVQSLDPPGVGARSLKECLQLQLEKKKKDRPEVVHALKIIKRNLIISATNTTQNFKTELE